MNDDSIFLPLLPTSNVIVPYGWMTLVASSEPYIQLLQDCINNEPIFFSVYSDENGIYKVGCACEIVEHQSDSNRLICRIYGLRRVSINSIVKFTNGIEEVNINGKTVCFKQEEPTLDFPYQFVNGQIYSDSNNSVREDIKEQVYKKFSELLIQGNKEIYDYFIELTKRDLDEGLSYFILDQLLEDTSEEANAFRYAMLTKQSETKRLRMLRNLILPDEPEA